MMNGMYTDNYSTRSARSARRSVGEREISYTRQQSDVGSSTLTRREQRALKRARQVRRQKTILLSVVMVLVIAGVAGGAYALFSRSSKSRNEIAKRQGDVASTSQRTKTPSSARSKAPVASGTTQQSSTAQGAQEKSAKAVTPVEKKKDKNQVTVYFTFDDGPSSRSTPLILDTLAAYDAHATFFVVGSQVKAHPENVKRAREEGHAIAIHTYVHDYRTIYASTDSFARQITKTAAVIKKETGQEPSSLVRFPGGSPSAGSGLSADKAWLKQHGYQYFDWNVSFGDSRTKPPAAGRLGRKVIKQIRAKVAVGARTIVVLGHDVNEKPWTAQDLAIPLAWCQKKGYAMESLTPDTPPVHQR